MRLEDIIITVINLIILVLLEATVLSIAWFFGTLAGAAVNYTLIGGVVFVVWLLWVILIALAQIKLRREEQRQ